METALVLSVCLSPCSCFLCLVDRFDQENWLKSLVCDRSYVGVIQLASFAYLSYISLIKVRLPVVCVWRTLLDALNFVSALRFCSHIFFFLAAPHVLWDLSSLTRGQTRALGSESTKS